LNPQLNSDSNPDPNSDSSSPTNSDALSKPILSSPPGLDHISGSDFSSQRHSDTSLSFDINPGLRCGSILNLDDIANSDSSSQRHSDPSPSFDFNPGLGSGSNSNLDDIPNSDSSSQRHSDPSSGVNWTRQPNSDSDVGPKDIPSDDSSAGIRPLLFGDDHSGHHFAPGDLWFGSDSVPISEFLELEEAAEMDTEDENEPRIEPLPESEMTFGIDLSLLDSSSEPEILDDGEDCHPPPVSFKKSRAKADKSGRSRSRPMDSDSDSLSDSFKRNQ
jgi:hypothetical protein